MMLESLKTAVKVKLENVDVLFVDYVCYFRIFSYYLFIYKRDLSYEEMKEFGLIDDYRKAVQSYTKKRQKESFIFLLVNHAYNLKYWMIQDAYDEAIEVYKKAYKFKDRDANLRDFKEQREQILKEIINNYQNFDGAKYFEVFEQIAKHVLLDEKEINKMKKHVEKDFDTLLFVDDETIKRDIEKGV